MNCETLFYTGVGILCAAAILGIVLLTIHLISGKHLKKQLENEYGKEKTLTVKKAPHIIAGSYQILQQIGSGGGGIVYLGRHLRLDKMIVLKADRRTQKIAKDELRREADIFEKSQSNLYSTGI